MVSSYPVSPHSGILVSILMNVVLPDINIAKVLTLGYIAYIVYNPCLLIFSHVFVLPLLDYCDVVWTPSSVQHFKCLERLHLHSKFNSPTSSTDYSVCVCA